jgi:hypothetical protein
MTKTLVMVLVLGTAAPVLAQTPESAASAPAALPNMAVPAAIPLGSRVGEIPTTYEEGGRRDPFSSLVVKRTSAGVMGAIGRPRTGLASIALADVSVRGIVRSGSVMMAVLEGPNKRSFIAKTKDLLLDATVSSIDPAGVVFAAVVDPGMAPNHVRKALRPAGEEVR